MVIITGALGVGGNLLGWIPMLTRGEVCRRAFPLPALVEQQLLLSLLPLLAHTHTPKRLTRSLSFVCAHTFSLSLCLQRKRHIRDEWAFSLWERDRAIKKEFK